jgi:hypothetical protein
MNQNGFTNSLVIGIIALAVLVLSISGYLIFVKKPEQVVENPTPIPTPTPTLPETKEEKKIERISVLDLETYRNEDYRFEFKYPKDYKIDPSSKVETGLIFKVPKVYSGFEFWVRVEKKLDSFKWGRGVAGDIYFDPNDRLFKREMYASPPKVLEPWGYTKSGEAIYLFSTSDVGVTLKEFAIPNYSRNFLILIGYSLEGNAPDLNLDELNTFEENFKQILSTFRFLE